MRARRVPDPRGAAGVRIRPMTAGDLETVLRIERASFTIPWSKRTFRGLLDREDAILLVAEDAAPRWPGEEGPAAADERLLGYAVVWLAGEEAELGDLAVGEDARGRGVGAALVEAALAEAAGGRATRIFLEVRESNRAALRLYEGAGFERVGIRRGYYLRPVEDALVMRRALGPEDAATGSRPR